MPAGGQGSREPITDAGRFAHEAAAYDPARGRPLPRPRTTSASRPACTATCPAGPPPARSAPSVTADGSQMLAVVGRPNADLAAAQPAGRDRTGSPGWTSTTRPRRFPYTPGQVAPTTNDQAIRYVGDQGRAQGAAYFSRLEGAVFDRGTLWFTATQGGGPAETSVGPDRRRLRQRHRPGVGLPPAESHPAPRLRVAGPRRAGPARQRHRPSSGRRPAALRGRRATATTCAGSRRRGSCSRSPRTCCPVSSTTSSPGPPSAPTVDTLFVNIQAGRALTFAIWGPWQRLGF